MKRLALGLAALLALACGGDKKPMNTPKDLLVHRLFTLAENGTIAYGHQDDLAYGHAWCVEDWEADALERSDVKAVTGRYPLVAGFDLGGIEMGDSCNLDGVPFGLIRKAALAHMERGGIVTFSWHARNPLTGGNTWDTSSTEVVSSILPGGPLHGMFRQWLERAADFIESLGPDAALIFRPWHENTESWFWWGKDLCSENDFRELFRLTWVYFNKERGLKNLVWCYSPNGPISPEDYMARYPGDEFVDLMGLDLYEFVGADGNLGAAGVHFSEGLKYSLNSLTAISYEHHKLMALTETGLEGIPDPHWWTGVLEPCVKGYPISYLLTWRNAHDRPGHYYAAWEGSPDAADMQAFSESDSIAFLK